MTERRSPRKGDIQTVKEASLLDGLSWASWRHTLDNKLKDLNLQPLNGDLREVVHGWFVLRHLRKLEKISEAKYEEKKRSLFEGKTDDFFDNPTVTFSIKLITKKTEKLTQK